MSCIPALLALKGGNEFLQLGESPNMIEDGGEYEGYNYLITFAPLGHRCGYVAISNSHPLYNEQGNEQGWNSEKIQDLDVHGDVTFFDNPSDRFGIPDNCEEKWIGFDAAHCNDKRDMETLKKINEIAYCAAKYVEDIIKISLVDNFQEVRTKDYMIEECKQLILQLKKLENNHE